MFQRAGRAIAPCLRIFSAVNAMPNAGGVRKRRRGSSPLSMADLESERVLLSVADGYKRLPSAPRGARCETTHRRRMLSAAPEGERRPLRCSPGQHCRQLRPATRQIEPARQRLATAPLSIAPENNREVQVAKKAALQRLALDERGAASRRPRQSSLRVGDKGP